MASQTRETILQTLRARSNCTVKELAEAAGISPVSVRHHLGKLQVDGMLHIEEVKHGVGRPRQLFSLTNEAHELFPTRYLRLTNRLLDQMKESLPLIYYEGVLSNIADSMAEDYAIQLEGLPLTQRLPRLIELLNLEGFTAESERRGDVVVIRAFSCPYLAIGQKHPEVCMIDKTFIANALSLPVEQVQSMLDGDAHCAYSVQITSEKAHE
ncbi:MAG TPA: ArsR family transcriptional regulator [Anaerolineales bacterium]|nr:ArsR family transcriptional regulator [Anaerolineales bacterium]